MKTYCQTVNQTTAQDQNDTQDAEHLQNHWASAKRLLVIFLMASMMSCLFTGCVPFLVVTAVDKATAQYNVDPDFVKTHDLKFTPPLVKERAVLLVECAKFGVLPENECANAFLEAAKNSGAFAEVVRIKNDNELKQYSGWKVVRVQIKYEGRGEHHIAPYNCEFKQRISVDFESQVPNAPLQMVYPYSLLYASFGAKVRPDDLHPPGDLPHAVQILAQETFSAALFDAEKAGFFRTNHS